MSDEDQFFSMRAVAYVNVLQAGAALAAAIREQQQEREAVRHLEQTVEAARFYAPEPLDQTLRAVVPAAHRWVGVAKTNGAEHSFAREAGEAVERHLSQIRTLMRDAGHPARPAEPANSADAVHLEPEPTQRYADDSTMLARLRIGYAREKPLSQQREALNASWWDILSFAFSDLLVSLLWTTVCFKAAVWLISTYWWTDLPPIGWLPALGLMLVLKLVRVKTKPTEPFALPPQSGTSPAQAQSGTADSATAPVTRR